MKKLFQDHRLLKLLALACPLMLTGCTNDDYDFDKVDYTLGFGSGELALPGNNSTSEILLDDLLDIEGSDLISTLANGDYVFEKTPDAVDPVSVLIEPIVLSQNLSAGQTIDIQLPQQLSLLAGQSLRLADYNVNIEAREAISLLSYEFSVPDDVKSLEYVGVGNVDGVPLKLNLTLPSAITEFDYIFIDLPDMLQMTGVNLPAGAQFDESNNQLTINNYQPAGTKLQLQFNVKRINMGTIDADNFAELQNGTFRLQSKVELGFKVAQLTVPSASAIQIGGEADFQNLSITSARGVFDPEINLTEAGSVEITDIPDFLTDEEVVADLDNPQIWLNIRSTMPLGGNIKARLYSDTYTQGITLDGAKAIHVNASPDGISEVATQAVICRYEPDNVPAGTQVITDDNLSKLITTLREGMVIHFDITEVKAEQTVATVALGQEYRLTPDYRFTAPLAFGPEARIVYSDTENDWNGDLDGLSLSKDGYLEVKATAVNQIPADLTLEVTPLGVDGQRLSDVTVEHVKATVAGTKTGSVESPIEVRIKDATGSGIGKLDGITIKLKADSNSELRGVTLNKSTQTLVLKDIEIKVVGKIVYDAN